MSKIEKPRVAIVTGAAQGIGHSVALRLSRDGFLVVVNDIPSKQERLDDVVKAMGGEGKALAAVGDAANANHVQELVDLAVNKFGGLHVFVANAGINYRQSILETTEEDWEIIMKVNALSVFLAFKIAGRQMIKQGSGGRLIAASSVSGKRGFPMLAVYSASKFFVRGIIQSAAFEFGRYGITVNGYAPGLIDTAMLQTTARKVGTAWVERTAGRTALKTIGQPEDVAGLVSYLASDDSKFITGQTINANGGYVAFD